MKLRRSPGNAALTFCATWLVAHAHGSFLRRVVRGRPRLRARHHRLAPAPQAATGGRAYQRGRRSYPRPVQWLRHLPCGNAGAGGERRCWCRSRASRGRSGGVGRGRGRQRSQGGGARQLCAAASSGLMNPHPSTEHPVHGGRCGRARVRLACRLRFVLRAGPGTPARGEPRTPGRPPTGLYVISRHLYVISRLARVLESVARF